MTGQFNSNDGIAAMGLRAFSEDTRGLNLSRGNSRHFAESRSDSYEWTPGLRIHHPEPAKDSAPSTRISSVMLPAIRNVDNRGKRILPGPEQNKEAVPRPGLKLIMDDKNPGLLRRRRPSLELSLESSFARKRRVPLPQCFTKPRAIADSSPDFFKPGGLVPGSSFMLQGKNDSVNRLNEGWRKFNPERASTLRSYAEISKMKYLEDQADEIKALQDWETATLKEYSEANFVDPDHFDGEPDND
jgi:hypothetical protein